MRGMDSGYSGQKRARGEGRAVEGFGFQNSRPVECKAYSTGVSVSAFRLFLRRMDSGYGSQRGVEGRGDGCYDKWIVDMVAGKGRATRVQSRGWRRAIRGTDSGCDSQRGGERREARDEGFFVSAFQCFKISDFLRGMDSGYGSRLGGSTHRGGGYLVLTRYRLLATRHGGSTAQQGHLRSG